MSLRWVTSGACASDPIPVAPDETFISFPGITSQLTSFTPVTGVLYLSSYRLVFQESRDVKRVVESVPLKQLILPLHRWLRPEIGQPWFGPNFYEGEVHPTPGGGLQLAGGITLKAKFIFNEGGIERFHKALEAAIAAARERQRNRTTASGHTVDEELPVYESAGEGSGVPPQYD